MKIITPFLLIILICSCENKSQSVEKNPEYLYNKFVEKNATLCSIDSFMGKMSGNEVDYWKKINRWEKDSIGYEPWF